MTPRLSATPPCIAGIQVCVIPAHTHGASFTALLHVDLPPPSLVSHGNIFSSLDCIQGCLEPAHRKSSQSPVVTHSQTSPQKYPHSRKVTVDTASPHSAPVSSPYFIATRHGVAIVALQCHSARKRTCATDGRLPLSALGHTRPLPRGRRLRVICVVPPFACSEFLLRHEIGTQAR